MIRILSFDPGEKNFAFSVTEHKTEGQLLKSRCIDNGLIKNTITDLKDSVNYAAQAKAFVQEIELLRTKYEIDHIALERFMGRGIKVGTTSETTNIMIGLLTSSMWKYNDDVILVNAAVWKNAYNAVRKDSLTSSQLKDEYKLICTTPHQFDATLIGVFIASSFYEVRPFKPFYDEGFRNKLMTSVERTSREPLFKRKTQR